MTSISSRSDSVERGRAHRRADADDPADLLVFSCVGLLIDVLALLLSGAAHATPLRLAMIAGAAPVAALVALWLADRARRDGS
ncbi:hypothetical protein [Bradyrhizobium mercantei]|uniref:hypothetical protein n=1 Tax=Bradyrhizobium mercantei TaxID=1904807 RepID=UPI000975D11E|nr:hypothetical protein [Bradyrhizobium mercantei]